jgi:hypothetical protein
MRWILWAVAAVIVLVAIVAAIGAMLPRTHVASRSLTLRQPPEDVWPAVVRATRSSRVPVDVLESRPPTRHVTRVSASETMFGGTWTITIAPHATVPAYLYLRPRLLGRR